MYPISDDRPKTLTLKEASQECLHPPETVAGWCDALGIGFRDARGRWRVDPAKLDALIKARRVLGLDKPAEADAATSDRCRGKRRYPRFISRIAFRCPDSMAAAIQQAADRDAI